MQHLFHGGGAGRANRGESRVGAGIGGVLPATLALDAVGALDLDGDFVSGGQAGGLSYLHLRDDEQRGQLLGVFLQQRIEVAVGREAYPSLKWRPYKLLAARLLEAF